MNSGPPSMDISSGTPNNVQKLWSHATLVCVFACQTIRKLLYLSTAIPYLFPAYSQQTISLDLTYPKYSGENIGYQIFVLQVPQFYPDKEEQPKIVVFGLRRLFQRKYFGSSSNETHQKTCPGLVLCLITLV